MIKKIKEEEMVSVPREVLQDLIDNCGLAVAGTGKCEEVVGSQCRELQRYIDGANPAIENEEEFILEPFSLDDPLIEAFKNVSFVDFKK
jgi:hypothetical protein